jgi:hypothetical protein
MSDLCESDCDVDNVQNEKEIIIDDMSPDQIRREYYKISIEISTLMNNLMNYLPKKHKATSPNNKTIHKMNNRTHKTVSNKTINKLNNKILEGLYTSRITYTLVNNEPYYDIMNNTTRKKRRMSVATILKIFPVPSVLKMFSDLSELMEKENLLYNALDKELANMSTISADRNELNVLNDIFVNILS